MSIIEEKILFETLEQAGIYDFNKNNIKCLEYGFDSDTRNNVHTETNNLLKNSLKNNSLGELIHITGEMRALTDPFHRHLCDQINRQNKDVFKVIYDLPDEYQNSATKTLEYNLKNWKSNNWAEELRTIYSIANRSVNLYSYDTSDMIQYSVFGHKYILFHEKHEDKAKKKHTWLLESENLNSILTIKAEELINKAQDINEGNYRKFTQILNSYTSKHFHKLLQAQKNIDIEKLLTDKTANDLSDNTLEIFEALKTIEFIKINSHNQASLTQKGKSFFANEI